MGLLNQLTASLSTWQTTTFALLSLFAGVILLNVLRQLLARNPNEPPLVFHWVPLVGSTITYGIDPYKFFFACREKYGDVFTFVLLGRKVTVCLGTTGNEFVLNGKLKDVNAEEVYSPLCTPVFGSDVVYDCPNHKLMEQKKFVKFGLTTSAFRSYVDIITQETRDFYSRENPHKKFAASSGTVNLPPAMAELTIYTASHSLQGEEVREKFDSSFAELYHYLDQGFSPINFMLPWAPLPHNRKRDYANKMLTDTYTSIIKSRRKAGELVSAKQEEDMITNLMNCSYKDGTPVPDHEVAHMLIALLMAGQHSSSSTITWIFLRLATRPEIQDELLQEQKDVLGTNADGSIRELTYDDLARLPLHVQVVKETLRLHTPIHSILRQVKQPLAVEGTSYVIPNTHRVLASPGVTARTEEHFPQAMLWEPHRWDEHPSEKYVHLSPSHLKEGATEETEDYGYGMISKGASSPYLPFGAGRHRCIGEQFAYVQLQTILAVLIREMKFYNVKGREGELVGTDYSSLFSRPLQPAVVRWERREAKA